MPVRQTETGTVITDAGVSQTVAGPTTKLIEDFTWGATEVMADRYAGNQIASYNLHSGGGDSPSAYSLRVGDSGSFAYRIDDTGYDTLVRGDTVRIWEYHQNSDFHHKVTYIGKTNQDTVRDGIIIDRQNRTIDRTSVEYWDSGTQMEFVYTEDAGVPSADWYYYEVEWGTDADPQEVVCTWFDKTGTEITSTSIPNVDRSTGPVIAFEDRSGSAAEKRWAHLETI